MQTNTNLLTSPVGNIQFLAAARPIKGTNDKETYTIRLAFDVIKDKPFLDQVSEINDAKVVTASSYRGKSKETKELLSTGKALISANSKFQPKLYDSSGNELEDAPNFFSDSTGTAQMVVQPYKSDKGGTINLVAIIVHSIDGGSTNNLDRETRLSQLREAIEAATK